ncbi:enoyl-CoA hydratase-related protein [Salirhabdus sp. Marseille-P4669]|uniref:enoyl-CoA hydratase-related protein n=1 Tax=Salirhabdus sp. Marseille-P4669 TaxID=2042310 RepID=UPI000C7CD5C0|nr:enoyl-CoA hydratase-related protein [Salirhabdus sp. Marseille-P4669]
MNNVKLDITDEHIGILTIDRPDSYNALSNSLLNEINDSIEKIEGNDNLRVLIVTGSGKAFCAGADLKERKNMNEQQVLAAVTYIKETINKLESLRIPTIAAINGAAFGGGLELALACDIRLASHQAKMGLTETSLGIIPGAGGTQRLSRLIGIGKSKYLIYTAKRLTSFEALEYGILEKVVDAEELNDVTLEIARTIAQNGPIAVQQAKKAIQQGFNIDLPKALEIEMACYKQTIPTEDRYEGIRAFQEKRKPIYKGK